MKKGNRLTDQIVKNLKPRDKPYSVADGNNLYIEVHPNGGKYWRYKYRFPRGKAGKQKRLALGVYPKVTLKEARLLASEAAIKLAEGIDPGLRRKAEQDGRPTVNTFEAVALNWLEQIAPLRTEGHLRSVRGRLKRHLFPWIGSSPIDAVIPQDLLDVARRIEAKGHNETAHRVIGIAAQVIDYAIQVGMAQHNPARAIRSALMPVIEKHHAAITNPDQIGSLLVNIERYRGEFTTSCALKLSTLFFLRPGELRSLKWEHIDFEKRMIVLPVEHMKRRLTEKIAKRGEIAHTVPLAKQAVAIIEELRKCNGDTPFLFPHLRKKNEKTMSDATVLNALRSMGYGKETMSAHGFRHMASTILNELGYNKDFIEKQLAHSDPNRIRGVYNQAEYIEQRRAMMQDWADWLDARKEEAEQKEKRLLEWNYS